MDRFQAMATFVTVVETGGFASAARKLDVSPSVVSRVVTELEERLGVRLLTRTTRVVRLTEVGTAYFEDCRRILGEVDDAERSATGTHSTPRGQLTITAPMLFGKYFVMPVVIDYLSRYPQADVNAWFIDRVVNLVDEGIDVAVRIGEMPDSTLQAIRVGRVRRVLCASPGYLKEHGTPRRPEDLSGHTTILASGISTTPEWRLFDDGKQTVVRLQPRLTTTTNDAAITAAVAGFGITRLLSYQIAQHLRDGTLEIVLPDFEPPALPIQVVHREGRHATQKVRAFLDLAIDTLRADPSLN
ncbi:MULTISPECIES: LysR family transcriptional regulator [unclassified Caballeronia]|uniref:LysR family transcriptional regulator n=1 Tax=unclassified Caballeronia TaxID=2646786 RepID=UPI00285EF312|nr:MULTISPECIES: LysR family transcriptional regulator [unclassified Caballeronia]MDR5754557.1 LysR family transcriptional regulator [Caballeronia sp. LZ024]MDR5839528.1 LysR family transcriptional regulator [Caballeronia sp. LZ031]